MKMLLIIAVAIWVMYKITRYFTIALSEPVNESRKTQEGYSMPLDMAAFKIGLEYRNVYELRKMREEFFDYMKRAQVKKEDARYNFFLDALTAIDEKIASLAQKSTLK